MYIATSVMEEPADERFLDVVLCDQELVDLAFWMIVREEWPSVVKVGCTNNPPTTTSGTTTANEEGEHLSPSHQQQRSWARSPPQTQPQINR